MIQADPSPSPVQNPVQNQDPVQVQPPISVVVAHVPSRPRRRANSVEPRRRLASQRPSRTSPPASQRPSRTSPPAQSAALRSSPPSQLNSRAQNARVAAALSAARVLSPPLVQSQPSRPRSANAVRRPREAITRPQPPGVPLAPRAAVARRSPSQSPPVEAPRSRSVAGSRIPSRVVTPAPGTVEVRKALKQVAEQLGIQDELPELTQALHSMHKHCRHLSGKAGCSKGSSVALQQAAAVVQWSLRGRQVEHPDRGTFHRVGVTCPKVSVDVAVKFVLDHAAAAV